MAKDPCANRAEWRFLHGKAFLFSGGHGVIAGSSNFTAAGLQANLELNLGHYQPYVTGKVEEVNTSAKPLTVTNEPIEGWMAGMTMSYAVDNKDVLSRVKVGDPLDEATEMGPQARRELRDALHDQVERSVAKGARHGEIVSLSQLEHPTVRLLTPLPFFRTMIMNMQFIEKDLLKIIDALDQSIGQR